ncbi:MAG: hypothetical protein JSS83_17435 [Cyanobacteria bacterium SZAS LIN-3]|nr:hypothetical protein [Cyanobacteria bacterium SZAS LIN-3]
MKAEEKQRHARAIAEAWRAFQMEKEEPAVTIAWLLKVSLWQFAPIEARLLTAEEEDRGRRH